MKKAGGILAILAGGKKPKAEVDDDDLDDDLDEAGDDESDDLDDDASDLDEESREICDRLFDAFEARDHAGLWAALGDAVELVRGD